MFTCLQPVPVGCTQHSEEPYTVPRPKPAPNPVSLQSMPVISTWCSVFSCSSHWEAWGKPGGKQRQQSRSSTLAWIHRGWGSAIHAGAWDVAQVLRSETGRTWGVSCWHNAGTSILCQVKNLSSFFFSCPSFVWAVPEKQSYCTPVFQCTHVFICVTEETRCLLWWWWWAQRSEQALPSQPGSVLVPLSHFQISAFQDLYRSLILALGLRLMHGDLYEAIGWFEHTLHFFLDQEL